MGEIFIVIFQTCNLQRMEKEQRRKATPKPQAEPQFVFQVTNIPILPPLFSSGNWLVYTVVNIEMLMVQSNKMTVINMEKCND